MTAADSHQRPGSLDRMTTSRVVTAREIIQAPPGVIFELIADPAQQPAWDGNDNLGRAEPGQRITGLGQVFTMTLASGSIRENHVVEFVEDELIAWKPSEVGKPCPGHVWRWELRAVGESHTEVTHSYDWTDLTDQQRMARARGTTAGMLRHSVDRLKRLAENH